MRSMVPPFGTDAAVVLKPRDTDTFVDEFTVVICMTSELPFVPPSFAMM
jgi:hypothetical protein